MTLVEFMEAVAHAKERHEGQMRHALERAAVIVEREAKAEMGVYQNAAPPFAGWAELADATKDDRVRQGFSDNDPGVRTGEMRDAIDHEVEAHDGGGTAVIGSPDEKMLAFEMGTFKQPPRSALGGALVRKTDEVVKVLGQAAVDLIEAP